MNFRTKTCVVIGILVFGACLAGGVAWTKSHTSRGPWIGVFTQAVDKELNEAFDLGETAGVVIVDVVDDSPADEAGFRRRDVVVRFNGKEVDGTADLDEYVDETRPGDTVAVVVVRKGTEKTLTLEVGRRPRSTARTFTVDSDWSGGLLDGYGSFATSRGAIGLTVQDLTKQLGEYFGVQHGEGALVIEVARRSPAEKAGLKAGDVIIGADGETVTESADLQDVISEKEEGDEVAIKYLRTGFKGEVTVEVEEEPSYGRDFTWFSPTVRIPDVPSIPAPPRLDHFYLSQEEYREQMEEVREEMEKVREELRDLELKLD